MEYIWQHPPLFCSPNNHEFNAALKILDEILTETLFLLKQGQPKAAKKYFADTFSAQFPPNPRNLTDIDYDLILDGPLANEFEYLFEKLVGVLREISQEEVEYDYDFDRKDFADRLEKVKANLADLSDLY